MGNVKIVVVLVLTLFLTIVTSNAQEVRIRAISSGTYEQGKFIQGREKYEADLEVDNTKGYIEVKKVHVSDREGRIEEGISYEIIKTLLGEGFTTISLPENKKGQEIHVAVRDVPIGATETMVLGENFYEYCSTSGGKFYLESGEVIIVPQKL